nr:D-cysteine desulfhydrase family protein [Rhodomicrobium lacus]
MIDRLRELELSAVARRLEGFPRFPLAHLPTPLEPLDRLSSEIGGPRIWVKRDDCSGLATGGNKARKLEYLVGDALAQRCDTLISAGALQSNHARQVAAAAARAGLRCVLVLTDTVAGRDGTYSQTGNAQIDRILGADIHIVPGHQESAPVCAAIAEELRNDGATPYVIPIGGSNGVGTLGYIGAFFEIQLQMELNKEPFDLLTLASGSGGTQAGLMLGARLSSWSGRIVGMSVGARSDSVKAKVNRAGYLAADLLKAPSIVNHRWLPEVEDSARGAGYGIPDPSTFDAIALTAKLEGLLLDPVYSGKGMAGLIAACQGGRFDKSIRNVVFVHTGGTAALAAYPELTVSSTSQKDYR